ncbi:MAG: RHS repeat-associated core domain-containing protein, partial [Roseofilum sp. Belize BBD 4]|uniref:RHS repeat-associated core domain-containing protein n=1 Tax=Roseofilum sp. Belize BBD 4 TaxID=2821500 RepID=UPI001AFE5145
YNYDAYGNLIAGNGSENPYLFAGEQRDVETGLDYLRARYYDPTLGRFISRDAYQGSLNDPMSQHKYQYAHANPVVNTDPSGYFSLGQIAATLTLHTTLAGLSFTTGAAGAVLATGGSLGDALALYDQFFAGMADSLTFGRSTEARRLIYGNQVTNNHRGLFFNLGRLGGAVASVWIGAYATTFSGFSQASWVGRAALGYDIYGAGVGINDVFHKWANHQKLSLWDILAFLPLFGWFNINYEIVSNSRYLASVFGDISVIERGRKGGKIAGTGNDILAELGTGSSGDFIVEAAKPSTKGKLVKRHVYENPGHHQPGHANFKPNKSVLPDNHTELFLKSVPIKDAQGRIVRYAIDESGNIHQFQPAKFIENGVEIEVYHWAGAQNAPTIKGKKTHLTIPPEALKELRRRK